jgi:hypothetical protein
MRQNIPSRFYHFLIRVSLSSMVRAIFVKFLLLLQNTWEMLCGQSVDGYYLFSTATVRTNVPHAAPYFFLSVVFEITRIESNTAAMAPSSYRQFVCTTRTV